MRHPPRSVLLSATLSERSICVSARGVAVSRWDSRHQPVGLPLSRARESPPLAVTPDEQPAPTRSKPDGRGGRLLGRAPPAAGSRRPDVRHVPANRVSAVGASAQQAAAA